ncbi:MAG: hypothetical protein DMG56_28755 [Acidobacteria bacterium]|nr:MAG: hypothetical protein DMG56_28755 [Acidobacteriota bacterium]
MIMKSRAMLQLSISFVVLLFGLIGLAPITGAEDSKDTQALLEALGKSKLTVLDGVRQAAKGGAVPISAKFELEDGKLLLSVYTAGKGFSVPPEQNVLQELSGSPEGEKWTPNVEVFKDVAHVARSSAQLTLMALGNSSLADIIARAQKVQSGTVFSVTPVIRNHTAVTEVLMSDHGKVQKVLQPL